MRSINQLKKRDDIVISKPDKGSGVVVMNKSDYIRLLSEASINDETKFQPVSLERPRTKGRPPKNYHPLLEKEKHLDSVVRRILPKQIADTVCLKGSRLAHLYGLPKTHKEKKQSRFLRTRPSTRIGSMRHIILTSPKRILSSFYEWLQSINCFNSTVVFMNNLME